MRITNQKEWIEIEFRQYAKEGEYTVQGLIDEENCVEIGFNYNIEDGWGSVGAEYFYTKDIKALAEGLSRILLSVCKTFTYSGGYPYKSLTPDPFYTFFLNRDDNQVVFSLKIHDRLSDYISVTENMELSKFESIVNELKEAARKFPIV